MRNALVKKNRESLYNMVYIMMINAIFNFQSYFQCQYHVTEAM